MGKSNEIMKRLNEDVENLEHLKRENKAMQKCISVRRIVLVDEDGAEVNIEICNGTHIQKFMALTETYLLDSMKEFRENIERRAKELQKATYQ